MRCGYPDRRLPADPRRRSSPATRGEVVMGTVTEVVALIGADEPVRVVERDEELLLAEPHPSRLPMKLWSDHEPLEVVHHPREYVVEAFAAPRCVYENDGL